MIIGLSGVPSSGKTTLAEKMKVDLWLFHLPEYATYHQRMYGMIDSPEEQIRVTIINYYHELRHRKMFDDVLIESPAFMSKVYHKFNYPTEYNTHQHLIYNDIDNFRYDYIFHLEPLKFKQNGIRYNYKYPERMKLNETMKKEASTHTDNLIILPKASLEERLQMVNDALREK